MVAKIVATRADYEVTRQAVNRKNPAEDTDWDRKVDALRCAHTHELVAVAAAAAVPILVFVLRQSQPFADFRSIYASKCWGARTEEPNILTQFKLSQREKHDNRPD